MSLFSPKTPAAPPPPPPPLPAAPQTASNAINDAAAQTRAAAAAAAGGAGFDNTILTGPRGAPKPSTAGAQLFGQSSGKQTLGE